MQLIKVSSGLLEQEDFLITSPMEDFLGEGDFIRDLESFTLLKGEIERRIPYENFLITVDKEVNSLGPYDLFEFYVCNGNKKAGIQEYYNNYHPGYWKLIYQDGYVQGYTSEDKKQWTLAGGKRLEDVKYQGFKTIGNRLTLKNYKVFSSPYLTIKNYFSGTLVELVDLEGNVLKTRQFDDNMECNIFLDYPVRAKLIFKDTIGEVLYSSPYMNFTYGDEYICSAYNLQLFYKGRLLTYETTTLQGLLELLVLRNGSSEDNYKDLTLEIRSLNNNLDTIEISFDKEDGYSDKLLLSNLSPGEEKEIYIRIAKEPSQVFTMRDFYLDIY